MSKVPYIIAENMFTRTIFSEQNEKEQTFTCLLAIRQVFIQTLPENKFLRRLNLRIKIKFLIITKVFMWS